MARDSHGPEHSDDLLLARQKHIARRNVVVHVISSKLVFQYNAGCRVKHHERSAYPEISSDIMNELLFHVSRILDIASGESEIYVLWCTR